MTLDLTTPALLFPTISLLLLAYTNRFLAIANLIRSLHARYQSEHDERLKSQIRSLRSRVLIIRNMQAFGISSLFLCVLCMFLLFAGWALAGQLVFGLSLVLLMISLGLSFREIQVSVQALRLQLSDLETEHPEA